MFAGEVVITANEPSQPTSSLTCLLGPPFDDLRCKLNGATSNRKNPVIEASSMEANSTDVNKLLAASRVQRSGLEAECATSERMTWSYVWLKLCN